MQICYEEDPRCGSGQERYCFYARELCVDIGLCFQLTPGMGRSNPAEEGSSFKVVDLLGRRHLTFACNLVSHAYGCHLILHQFSHCRSQRFTDETRKRVVLLLCGSRTFAIHHRTSAETRAMRNNQVLPQSFSAEGSSRFILLFGASQFRGIGISNADSLDSSRTIRQPNNVTGTTASLLKEARLPLLDGWARVVNDTFFYKKRGRLSNQ